MDIRVRVALLAIVLNVALVVIKFLLAGASGSASIRADAFHSLSDVLVSVLVLVGVGLGTRASKERKPGGVNWAGVEHLVAIIVGIFILYAAFEIFRQAVAYPTESLVRLPIALVGIFICVLVSFLISRIEIRIGNEHGSPALIADGFHARMNMYSSIGVMVCLVGFMIGLNLDSTAAAVIALLIAVTGVEVVIGSVRGLAKGKPIEEYQVFQFIHRKLFARTMPEGIPGTPIRIRAPRKVVMVTSLLILIGAWLLSAISFARPGERLLVFRFGRCLSGELGPGIHVHLPWPMDRGRVVDVGRIRRAEIGFRTEDTDYAIADRSYQWESRHTAGSYAKKVEESIMLTGDINLVDINSVVQYRVSDARRFLLATEDPDQVVRAASEMSLRLVVANEAIDDLLTRDRSLIEDRCVSLIQAVLDPYDAGLEIIAVKLQDVHPPLEVVASFRDVASAREDRSRLMNEAYAYRNQVLPKARGQASKDVLSSEAASHEKVRRSSGEAGKFLALLEQYRRAPEVTKTRLYLESLETVLPAMEKFIVEPEAGEEPVDLRFYSGTRTDALGGQ